MNRLKSLLCVVLVVIVAVPVLAWWAALWVALHRMARPLHEEPNCRE